MNGYDQSQLFSSIFGAEIETGSVAVIEPWLGILWLVHSTWTQCQGFVSRSNQGRAMFFAVKCAFGTTPLMKSTNAEVRV